jgi:hypothetical protein
MLTRLKLNNNNVFLLDRELFMKECGIKSATTVITYTRNLIKAGILAKTGRQSEYVISKDYIISVIGEIDYSTQDHKRFTDVLFTAMSNKGLYIKGFTAEARASFLSTLEDKSKMDTCYLDIVTVSTEFWDKIITRS